MSKHLVKIFKALSDEARVEMVRYLLRKKEISCQEVSKRFSLSQPALSHHFNKLIDANIIKVRKQGVSHFYSINNTYLKEKGLNMKKIINM